jgi:hypothetical protein
MPPQRGRRRAQLGTKQRVQRRFSGPARNPRPGSTIRGACSAGCQRGWRCAGPVGQMTPFTVRSSWRTSRTSAPSVRSLCAGDCWLVVRRALPGGGRRVQCLAADGPGQCHFVAYHRRHARRLTGQVSHTLTFDPLPTERLPAFEHGPGQSDGQPIPATVDAPHRSSLPTGNRWPPARLRRPRRRQPARRRRQQNGCLPAATSTEPLQQRPGRDGGTNWTLWGSVIGGIAALAASVLASPGGRGPGPALRKNGHEAFV